MFSIKVNEAAQRVVDQDDPAVVIQEFNLMMVYAVADALADIRNLRAAPLMAETARTDKQIGASARSTGSTSAVEKPGFADLLGFAIEHGAIQKEVSETTLTLSTSPYALLVAASGKDSDTAAFYEQNEFFNRIGVSANFNLSNKEDVLANASRKQLNEWSIRVRLWGDRSVRSRQFIDNWDQKVRPFVRRRIEAISAAESATFNEPAFNQFRLAVRARLNTEFATFYAGIRSRSADERKAEIRTWLLRFFKVNVFDPIVEGETNPQAAFRVDPVTRERVRTEVVAKLKDSEAELQLLRDAIDKVVEEFNKGPLLTFVYNNQRVADGSDYSVYKALFEQDVWNPMKMVVNVGVSVYNHPDATKNQEKVRDIAAALSFEGKANSPFNRNDPDLSKITYSFNGRYQRMKENEGVPGKKADIAVAQFKLEIPIRIGVSIPFSFTYANATELIKEKEVRGNFGITFDVDKLFALTRSALNR